MQSKHPFHSIDYSYLRPSKKWLRERTEDEVFYKENGEILYRNVFFKQDINAEWRNNIAIVKSEMVDKNYDLPEWWTDHDSWRFIDAAKNNKEHFHNDIGWHIEWMKKMESYNLDEISADLIGKGRIRIGPRDKDGYITLILWLDSKVPLTEETAHNSVRALEFVMCVMKRYCMLPHYSELFNLFIDMNELTLINPF